jgi:hypothetical protein
MAMAMESTIGEFGDIVETLVTPLPVCCWVPPRRLPMTGYSSSVAIHS